jgi:hypothetical protein
MISPIPDFEPLTNKIIACAIEVHRTLGPGLLESVYQECMMVELKGANLHVESDRRVPIAYKGQTIRSELMNFNSVSLRSGLRRLDHPELYKQKHIPSAL